MGNKRNYSLSIWDHKDNFLCLLKSANGDINGQCYQELISENIYGEKSLTFNIPAYIYDIDYKSQDSIDGFKENEKWNYIFNEQKIRYIEYDEITNKPKSTITEFVIKSHNENRSGYEKVIEVTCESLATYELSKVGWAINFNTEYITQYELENIPEDFLQLDYWLKKIFYKETNLGRVSTTTECTYLLQGLQLRNNDGAPISNEYSVDDEGNYQYETINEPICNSTTTLNKYLNEAGWTWEIQASYKNNPAINSTTTFIYEEPVVDRYIEVVPNYYKPMSYQKTIGAANNTKTLKPHPIPKEDYGKYEYVTEIKKQLISCERSNIFSIIQDLCEAFGVWAYFIYTYNDQGKIVERKILFKTEAVNEEIKFDFSYGKNLSSCSRTIDSNELVTKLIVPDTQSSLDTDKILSIKQATSNPTGEGYIYNFDYFYNLGTFTKGEDIPTSDEYKINLHCGKLKKYNEKIINLQNYLVPLYNRKTTLDSDLTTQLASKTALMDNIKSIQDKIDAIPSNQQIIQSWSNDKDQYNYIGELKTISTTTIGNATKYYINFGREDVIYRSNISTTTYKLNNENELIELSSTTILPYFPRYYTQQSWNVGITVSGNDFTNLSNNNGVPDYSKIDNEVTEYIKGFYLNDDPGRSYLRVRYKYAPLLYYYRLIKNYWDKLKNIEQTIKEIENNLQEINNKIIVNELELNNILNEKKELILQFEKEYGSYIKEGYWEPTDYQSQIYSDQLNTDSPSSIYEGLITVYTKLSDLNLNDSLHNYTYYVDLNIEASQIDIDSIDMKTKNPTGEGLETILPRYRGSDYEVFISNNDKVILGIAPSLIDTYKKNNDKYSNYYKCNIKYNKTNNSTVTLLDEGWKIVNDNVIVKDKYIYLSDDNLLTSSLAVYGTNDDLLEPYVDYTYSFDYAGYTDEGERIDLNDQSSYLSNIHYDYITKITLKNTNKVNRHNNFIVKYSKETTLQYLYNDSIATSNKYSVPQITYNVSIVDLSSLNGYKDYKPILGQKVPIYDIEMRLNGYEGIITSIERELDSPENTTVTISTYQTRFTDIFQKLTATMTDIRYNSNEIYNAVNSFENNNGTIKTEVFQKSLQENNYQIQLGVNNEITIDKQSGITLVDQDNNKAVKLIGNGIFLTNEYNGNNSQWKTGITGDGINANTLITGNIDTKNINIWNASEGQIRFIWNEQGLFAYGSKGIPGTTTNAPQDFVDYNKYVKFNQDGLQFNDNGKSALSLTWKGLSIDAQSGALRLDADNGLVLKENRDNNIITRLELGKLGNVYGLKLYDKNGEASFQSDSDGNLWLSKYIKVGGEFNGSSYNSAPTAGIVGANNVPEDMQMGVRRDQNGNTIWDSSPIRFWAGIQTTTNYLDNIHITQEEVNSYTTIRNNFNNLNENAPSLAKFKVSSNGDILASGIDVGGWVGQGEKLRSFNYEALLRSGSYSTSAPVLAIGKPSTGADTSFGNNYNFRVYQDGSINIAKNNTNTNNKYYTGIKSPASSTDIVFYAGTSVNNPEFYVRANGTIQAKSLNLGVNNIEGLTTALANLTLTNIGGFNVSETGQRGIYNSSANNYYVGLKAPSNSNDVVFYAGTAGIGSTTNAFTVTANGKLTANSGKIGGWDIQQKRLYNIFKPADSTTCYAGMCSYDFDNGHYAFYAGTAGNINNSQFRVKYDGSVYSSKMNITGGTISIQKNSVTTFLVTNSGDVNFNGEISTYYNNQKYTGISTEIATIVLENGTQYSYRVVRGLVVGRRIA